MLLEYVNIETTVVKRYREHHGGQKMPSEGKQRNPNKVGKGQQKEVGARHREFNSSDVQEKATTSNQLNEKILGEMETWGVAM